MGFYDRYKKLTPEQERERDLILFGDHDPERYWGGTRHYSDLSPEGMEDLIRKGYADPEEEQNSCPSIGECLDFCKRHKGFRMHGYAVCRERGDCRVSVEGVEADPEAVPYGTPEYDETVQDFVDLFRLADDMQIGNRTTDWYCWFD